jgi:hypothetical protein
VRKDTLDEEDCYKANEGSKHRQQPHDKRKQKAYGQCLRQAIADVKKQLPTMISMNPMIALP